MNKLLTESLLGHTLADVERRGDKEIRFTRADGVVVRMYHLQECCERVSIEELTGDLQCLVGHPILVAKEVSGEAPESSISDPPESCTWTFYKFATVKGWVDVRWYGESSGYYSESVDIEVLKP